MRMRKKMLIRLVGLTCHQKSNSKPGLRTLPGNNQIKALKQVKSISP